MSSQQAINFHSITIGTKNTWDDWHLVPTSRPFVSPPPPKTSYVDLVGADGMMDMTENLTSQVIYANRTGRWEFVVVNPGQIDGVEDYTAWTGYHGWIALYSDLLKYLHGKEYRVILDDDPNYYYFGRLTVADWQSDSGNSMVIIDYNFEPFKTHITSGTKRF